MPDDTRRRVCNVNAAWLSEYGYDYETLERFKAESDRRGYAWNNGNVVAAMSAVGLPLITRTGRLVAALAVGAINDRMTDERVEQVVLPALREEAARLTKRLSDREDGGEA